MRRKLFESPGKALAWGLGASLTCSGLGLALWPWTLTVTGLACLAGCFNG
jgi:hypothetical protein